MSPHTDAERIAVLEHRADSTDDTLDEIRKAVAAVKIAVDSLAQTRRDVWLSTVVVILVLLAARLGLWDFLLKFIGLIK